MALLRLLLRAGLALFSLCLSAWLHTLTTLGLFAAWHALYKSLVGLPRRLRRATTRTATAADSCSHGGVGLPAVSRLSSRVLRVLGQNSGSYTLQGTNTYLLCPPPTPTMAPAHGAATTPAILVDTGEGAPAYHALLEKVIATEKLRITCILITHEHPDHVGGVQKIRDALGADIPVFKRVRSQQEAEEDMRVPPTARRSPDAHRAATAAAGGPAAVNTDSGRGANTFMSGDAQVLRQQGVFELHDGQEFSVSAADGDAATASTTTTVRTVFTPGHCADHCSFLVLEENALLSGDCVLGAGSAVFDDLASNMASLHKLRDIAVQMARTGQEATGRTHHMPQAPENTTAAAAAAGDDGGNNGGDGDDGGALSSVVEAAWDAPAADRAHDSVVIYPGHGPVVANALDKLDEYIAHRLERERQIVQAILSGTQQATTGRRPPASVSEAISSPLHFLRCSMTSWEIVCAVYGRLNPALFVGARQNVVHHLRKLRSDGLVSRWLTDLWVPTTSLLDRGVPTSASAKQC